jgi:hypothetical protein
MLKLLFSIVAIGLVLFGLQYGSLQNYKFFAPKYEDARREVFENTKSFRDGSARDFENLLISYLSANTEEGKQAILSVIRQRAYGVPQEQLPLEIKNLLQGK